MINSYERAIDALTPYMTGLEWLGIAYIAYTIYLISKKGY